MSEFFLAKPIFEPFLPQKFKILIRTFFFPLKIPSIEK